MIIGNKDNLVRFSFVNVWEPKASADGPPKFSVQVLIPKEAQALVAAVKKDIERAIQDGIGRGMFNAAASKSSAFRLCLRDGDEEALERDDGSRDYLKGFYFFNASSRADQQPAIVDNRGAPIMRRDDFYSGCWGIADIAFFPFAHGKGGVAAGLNSIMKRKDDDRMDGRLSTDQAFGKFVDEDDDSTEASDGALY